MGITTLPPASDLTNLQQNLPAMFNVQLHGGFSYLHVRRWEGLVQEPWGKIKLEKIPKNNREDKMAYIPISLWD